MEYPRGCVWCGAKVPRDSRRDLCRGHQNIAETAEERLERHVRNETPPMGMHVVNDDEPEQREA